MTADQIVAALPAEAVGPMAEVLVAILAAYPGEASPSAEAMAMILAELQVRSYRDQLRTEA